jgi:hypothetical protein
MKGFGPAGRVFVSAVLFLLALGPLQAAAPEAEDLYHQALSAYLDGQYDKAIILTAQSLEKDPTFYRSKNLLSILTAEKELEGKTVIWLTGKPSLVPAAPALPMGGASEVAALGLEVHALREKVDRFHGSQTRKNAELNGQIQLMQGLFTSNSTGQYSELQRAQLEIYNQLREANSRSGLDLWILYLLCFASMIFSFLAIWRKPRK